MDYVRRDIFDTIEDKDLDFKAIAHSIGLTPRYFDYFKSGERNIGFRHLIKLAYIIFPKSPHEKLSEWCLQLNTTECIKNAFEYAAITRNVELLKKLLDIHSKSSGMVKECNTIYGFIYNYMSNKIKQSELLHNVANIRSIKDQSLQILMDIYKCIGLFHQRRFLTLPDEIYDIEQKIKSMSDKRELFLKECFLHRLSEIAAHTHLHLNNLSIARYYSRILLNANVSYKTKSDALFVLGMSYLNENTDRCIEYLKQSHEIMKHTNVDFLIEYTLYNLHYAQLLLEIKLPEDADPALIAFEKFRNKEISEKAAKEVVINSGDADLIAYFDGISNEDNTKLYEKYHEFVADANLYYASIVVNELMKKGENSAFIKSLTKLKLTIFKKGEDLFEENFISCFNSNNISNGSNCA